MGGVRDVGGAGGVLDAEGVPLPPAGEHPGVHVPRAAAPRQRQRLARRARPLLAARRPHVGTRGSDTTRVNTTGILYHMYTSLDHIA